MRSEDDDWYDKVDKLQERLTGDDADGNIRRIARQEADNLLTAYIGVFAFFGMVWWANNTYGSTAGVCVAVGVTVAWIAWTVIRADCDPGTDRHKIDMIAHDLNRLKVITDAYAAGEPVWCVKEKEYADDKPQIVVIDSDRWDGSWRRVHSWMLELERIGPRQRRKKVLNAVHAAHAPLQQGAEMAKRDQAELILWARIYL